MLKKKLNSKNGVTIILGLVFFLIAAVLGGIVLSAAASGMGGYAAAREKQQAYLAVSSGARLLRDSIKDAAAIHTEVSVTSTDPGHPASSPARTTAITPTGFVLTDLLIEWIEYHLTGSLPAPGETLEIDAAAGTFSLPEVTGTFKMNNDYSITATLYVLSGANRSDEMTLFIPAEKTEHTATSVELNETTDAQGHPVIYETTTTTKTTDISWKPGTISKGGAAP